MRRLVAVWERKYSSIKPITKPIKPTTLTCKAVKANYRCLVLYNYQYAPQSKQSNTADAANEFNKNAVNNSDLDCTERQMAGGQSDSETLPRTGERRSLL